MYLIDEDEMNLNYRKLPSHYDPQKYGNDQNLWNGKNEKSATEFETWYTNLPRVSIGMKYMMGEQVECLLSCHSVPEWLERIYNMICNVL